MAVTVYCCHRPHHLCRYNNLYLLSDGDTFPCGKSYNIPEFTDDCVILKGTYGAEEMPEEKGEEEKEEAGNLEV